DARKPDRFLGTCQVVWSVPLLFYLISTYHLSGHTYYLPNQYCEGIGLLIGQKVFFTIYQLSKADTYAGEDGEGSAGGYLEGFRRGGHRGFLQGYPFCFLSILLVFSLIKINRCC